MNLANLRYSDPTNTLIDMDVTLDAKTANQFHAEGTTIPYTYHPDDPWPVAVAVGKLLANNEYEIAAYVAPLAPVPASVTRRQMLLGLVSSGIISVANAVEAAKTGAVPAAIQAVFDTLPSQSAKDVASITWASMSVAERDSPLVHALAAAEGYTDGQVDDLFRAWALL